MVHLYWLAEYISANPGIKTHELETFKFGVKSKTSNITLGEALKALCGRFVALQTFFKALQL